MAARRGQNTEALSVLWRLKKPLILKDLYSYIKTTTTTKPQTQNHTSGFHKRGNTFGTRRGTKQNKTNKRKQNNTKKIPECGSLEMLRAKQRSHAKRH